jgi:hypothetical protein
LHRYPLGTVLPVALITLSLIVMLYVLATIADTFFCPALETVSTIMKLSPDVAGLYKFANPVEDP